LAICEQEGIDAADELSKEWMHEGFLERFAGTVVDRVTGCTVTKERSSTMSTSRFCEFMEFIARDVAETRGIVINRGHPVAASAQHA